MIYAFLGSDTKRIRAKATAWIELGRAKDPQLTYVRITNDSFREEDILENLGGQSLFTKRTLISLDEVCAEQEEFIERHLALLADSENVFAIIETGCSPKLQKEIAAHATKTFSFEVAKKDTKPNFALWNAIDRRDGVGAWKEYQKEKLQGEGAEKLAGFIHSKLRRNIPSTKNAALQSRAFIDMYHEARRGEVDFEEGIELFLLTLSAH